MAAVGEETIAATAPHLAIQHLPLLVELFGCGRWGRIVYPLFFPISGGVVEDLILSVNIEFIFWWVLIIRILSNPVRHALLTSFLVQLMAKLDLSSWWDELKNGGKPDGG